MPDLTIALDDAMTERVLEAFEAEFPNQHLDGSEIGEERPFTLDCVNAHVRKYIASIVARQEEAALVRQATEGRQPLFSEGGQ